MRLSFANLYRTKLETIRHQSRKADADYDPSKDTATKRARKHAEEIRNRDLEAVIDLEDRLKVDNRWTTSSPEWVGAVKLLKEKKFTDALNALELLIVERIFELTKVNRSGTGEHSTTYL
jgi:ribosomal protein L10